MAGLPDRATSPGSDERQRFFRTHYASAELSQKQAERLQQKLTKVPDLVVFITVADDAKCSECGVEIAPGEFLFLEQQQPLCVSCADLDHLVFLPAGDTALTRRGKKHSPLSAVVMKFVRSRKRYERQGLMVTNEALAQAEDECLADSDLRADRRAFAAEYRVVQDQRLVEQMTAAILDQFPSCPPQAAQQIAEHAAIDERIVSPHAADTRVSAERCWTRVPAACGETTQSCPRSAAGLLRR